MNTYKNIHLLKPLLMVSTNEKKTAKVNKLVHVWIIGKNSRRMNLSREDTGMRKVKGKWIRKKE